MLHHIDFKLGDFILWLKKNFKKKTNLKLEEMKKLDKELQKEEEEMAEYKKKHCCFCFED
jgi:hypothetical protein